MNSESEGRGKFFRSLTLCKWEKIKKLFFLFSFTTHFTQFSLIEINDRFVHFAAWQRESVWIYAAKINWIIKINCIKNEFWRHLKERRNNCSSRWCLYSQALAYFRFHSHTINTACAIHSNELLTLLLQTPSMTCVSVSVLLFCIPTWSTHA